ncbi:DUF4369 domain-containing protein [Snuella sedimenti]|uniref:DUF4369 domain-containing protein n=1 Tax=Snuella sedimenti TaxID=2798802 RepID=A0A8J7IGU0_9FLAO|nr:DUF4369 domain-containing protein [Snuella sedimenti]MBJ6369557.1 DUF4369 domain-containing protein [Snuella sedimenti]
MKKLILAFAVIVIASCSKTQHDLTVKGSIKGLKKGTVYLKKIQDSTLITIDSLHINGDPTFELHSAIESPEVFFLYLDKNSNEDNRIVFFADKGITEVNTTLKNFNYDAKIKGCSQQETLEEYQAIIARLNSKNLDLIKENLEAQKNGDSSKINNIGSLFNNLTKRKYLYTVNFAINNKDSEVAPYLALTEIYDAKVNYLDTINNSLTPKIKASKYGQELQSYIDAIKSK